MPLMIGRRSAERAAVTAVRFAVSLTRSAGLLHRHAVFKRVACELYKRQAKRLDGTTFERVYHMVLAHSD